MFWGALHCSGREFRLQSYAQSSGRKPTSTTGLHFWVNLHRIALLHGVEISWQQWNFMTTSNCYCKFIWILSTQQLAKLENYDLFSFHFEKEKGLAGIQMSPAWTPLRLARTAKIFYIETKHLNFHRHTYAEQVKCKKRNPFIKAKWQERLEGCRAHSEPKRPKPTANLLQQMILKADLQSLSKFVYPKFGIKCASSLTAHY